MQLRRLYLKDFRKFKKAQFDLSPKLHLFIGPNAIGKTNILEALYMLAVGKSFRADQDREVIRLSEELGRVKGEVIGNHDEILLELVLTHGMVIGQKAPLKKYLVNDVPRRMIDFVGGLKVVLFWPEDLELVTDSPSIRRRYLDHVLVQTDREYRRNLVSYEKGIRQRNRILEQIRDNFINRNQLVFWDQLVIKAGKYISAKRAEYIAFINDSRKPFGNFHITYDMSSISEDRLAQYSEAEVASATTLVGPHRDDLVFFEKDRNMAKFGSRGEQRLTVLWLKLAEIEYMEKMSGERPVLLLDDIFSELDHGHREEIVNTVEKQQTIMTATDIHLLPKSLVGKGEVVELDKRDR